MSSYLRTLNIMQKYGIGDRSSTVFLPLAESFLFSKRVGNNRGPQLPTEYPSYRDICPETGINPTAVLHVSHAMACVESISEGKGELDHQKHWSC